MAGPLFRDPRVSVVRPGSERAFTYHQGLRPITMQQRNNNIKGGTYRGGTKRPWRGAVRMPILKKMVHLVFFPPAPFASPPFRRRGKLATSISFETITCAEHKNTMFVVCLYSAPRFDVNYFKLPQFIIIQSTAWGPQIPFWDWQFPFEDRSDHFRRGAKCL